MSKTMAEYVPDLLISSSPDAEPTSTFDFFAGARMKMHLWRQCRSG
jgi:hypothetical protein